jgi:endonuclease/exonuclease/phosphatase family metal-dependent hydrolase
LRSGKFLLFWKVRLPTRSRDHAAGWDLHTVEEMTINIISVYNRRDSGPRIRTWSTLQQALQEAGGEVLLLGDFNVHHPAWGGALAACEPHADHLWHEAQSRNLHLPNPRGEATWKRGTQETVIDLSFASEWLRNRVERCGPVPQLLRHGSWIHTTYT